MKTLEEILRANLTSTEMLFAVGNLLVPRLAEGDRQEKSRRSQTHMLTLELRNSMPSTVQKKVNYLKG